MARVTPAEYVEKHARRLKGSLEDIRRGIARVSVSPTEQAALAKDRMQTNLDAAIDSGKWEEGLRRVSLQDWKEKTSNVGVNRIAAGIDAATTKNTAMATRLLAAVDAAADEVNAMPKGTLEDSIRRAETFMRRMHGAQIK